MLWRALMHGDSRDSCIYAISSLSCHVLFILSLFSTAFDFLNISYRRYLYISLVKRIYRRGLWNFSERKLETCPVPQTIHFMVTTSQIATCILLPCKRKAPLLYLPASPKQILNRRDLKRRSSPPCVRLGSPPGLNLSLQPAQPSGLFS